MVLQVNLSIKNFGKITDHTKFMNIFGELTEMYWRNIDLNLPEPFWMALLGFYTF